MEHEYVDMSGRKDKACQVNLSPALDSNQDLEAYAMRLDRQFRGRKWCVEAKWEILCCLNGFCIACFILIFVLFVMYVTGYFR